MKKTIPLFVAILLLVTSSCKKKDTDTGGTWSFKGTNYTASSSFVGSTGLIIYLTAVNGTNSVACTFLGSTPPGTSGTFIVTDGGDPNTLSTVGLTVITASGSTYYSTGGNGSNQSVLVTIANSKVAVSGSSIEMQNSTNPSDSAVLQLNITE